MRETWYVLEDGSAVHPSEVAPNEDGRLAHKSGLVAMRDDGETPRSTGVDVEDGAQPFGGKGDHEGAAQPETTAEMQPAPAPAPKPRQGYKTRSAKGKARK